MQGFNLLNENLLVINNEGVFSILLQNKIIRELILPGLYDATPNDISNLACKCVYTFLGLSMY
jgi:hypothetical protein